MSGQFFLPMLSLVQERILVKKNGFRRDPPGTANTIGVVLFLKTSDFL